MSTLWREEVYMLGKMAVAHVRGKIFCLSSHSGNLMLFSPTDYLKKAHQNIKNGAMFKMPSGPQNMPTVGLMALNRMSTTEQFIM